LYDRRPNKTYACPAEPESVNMKKLVLRGMALAAFPGPCRAGHPRQQGTPH
jgi:hypothetical protein